MKYESFRYLFPNRPEQAVPISNLVKYEVTNDYIAEPKLNGSCCLIFIGDNKYKIYNRHREQMRTKISIDTIDKLKLSNKYWVWQGEYMNKSKLLDGVNINHQFVLHDCLVADGNILTGKNVLERYEYIKQLGFKKGSTYLENITDQLKAVKTFDKNFSDIFHSMNKDTALEGLVLKNRNITMMNPYNQLTNGYSSLKFRKAEKNYRY